MGAVATSVIQHSPWDVEPQSFQALVIESNHVALWMGDAIAVTISMVVVIGGLPLGIVLPFHPAHSRGSGEKTPLPRSKNRDPMEFKKIPSHRIGPVDGRRTTADAMVPEHFFHTFIVTMGEAFGVGEVLGLDACFIF